ncbi:hypothetical protein Hanom_Chr17g01539181 [Helianthus anomalus]
MVSESQPISPVAQTLSPAKLVESPTLFFFSDLLVVIYFFVRRSLLDLRPSPVSYLSSMATTSTSS